MYGVSRASMSDAMCGVGHSVACGGVSDTILTDVGRAAVLEGGELYFRDNVRYRRQSDERDVQKRLDCTVQSPSDC